MTINDFKRIVRGDVLRWTKRGDRADIGLVKRASDVHIHVLWEDGLDAIYTQSDARHLEYGA